MFSIALFALAAVSLSSVPVAGALHREDASRPDFAAVESVASAQALVAEGKLVPVLLFPAELGGDEIPVNTVYVTPEAAAAREAVIADLIAQIEAGRIDKMEVEPTYKGRSVVPATIVMNVWHSRNPGERQARTIPVW